MLYHKTTPKYFIQQPTVELSGIVVRSLICNQQLDNFRALRSKHKLDPLDPQDWYPLTPLLDFFREMSAHPKAPPQLMLIGAKVIETVLVPLGFRTLHDGIKRLNEIYRQYQKEEWFVIEEISRHHLRIIESSPLPHALCYGFLHGLAKHLHMILLAGRSYKNPENPDSDGAIYNVELI